MWNIDVESLYLHVFQVRSVVATFWKHFIIVGHRNINDPKQIKFIYKLLNLFLFEHVSSLSLTRANITYLAITCLHSLTTMLTIVYSKDYGSYWYNLIYSCYL